MDLQKETSTRRHSLSIKGNFLRHRRQKRSPLMNLPSPSQLLLLAAAAPLAAWVLVLTMKPTALWKMWWRAAAAWAGRRLLRDSGLYALVYTFPPLLSAAMAYLYLHHQSSKRRRALPRRPLFKPAISNPVVFLPYLGMLSALELAAAALMAALFSWTFFRGVASDFKKPVSEKFLRLHLSSFQVKIMRVGIRLGSVAEICLAFLFFPILKKMAVLKLAGVQFESAVRYHTWIGNLIVLVVAAHGGTIASVWASKKVLLRELTKWPRTGKVNAAGAIDFVIGLTIWITSLPAIRRKNFQLFYFVHHLHVAFVVFFLLHAGAHHFYLISAGVLLFGVDFLTRVNLSRPATSLVSAKALPCRAIELTISTKGIDYAPTSFMFVNVPAIYKFQWHPFSITSSSAVDRTRVSFLIKCHGRWTSSLYDMVKSKKPFHLAIEGPYGPPSPPYLRHEKIIMVAGGSGITPFLSILREISARTDDFPSRIGLLYAVQTVEDVTMIASVSKLLQKNIKEKTLKAKIFVTGERKSFSSEPTEELMHGTSTLHAGEESSLGFKEMAAATIFSFIVFLVALAGLSYGFVAVIGSEVIVLGASMGAIVGGATMAAILSRRKRERKGGWSYGDEMMLEDGEDGGEEDLEIIFGRRPDLQEEVEEMCMELGGTEFGVFVCGPESMQETVGRICSRKKVKGRSLNLAFHPINFSL